MPNTITRAAPRRHGLAMSIQLAILGLLPLAAQAQDANDMTAPPTSTAADKNDAKDKAAVNLNTIVVTAQKREQQVVDVPISISAYSADFIRNYNLTHVDDLGRYVSGVQVQVQSPNTPSIAIRGVTSDDSAPNTPARVSVFQDGVDISSATGSAVALYDMDHVEILKGPQGTLFGRGAESGALSFVTAKANDTTSGGFTAQAGNYSSKLLTGFFNTPISDGVDARVAIYGSRHDGYIRNTEGGRLNGEDTKAMRLSLHFKLAAGSYYDVVASYQRDAAPGDDFRSALPNAEGSTDLWGAASLTNPGYGGNKLGIRRKIESLAGIGSFELSDAWTLNTVTGLRKFNDAEYFDADGSQLDMLNFGNIGKSHEASQEVRFNFDDGGRLTGFFGANFFYENGQQYVPFQTNEKSLLPAMVGVTCANGSAATQGIINLLFNNACNTGGMPLLDANNQPNMPYSAIPLLGTPLNTDEREGFTKYGSTRSYELFADGTYRITDKFDLTAGVRASHEKITSGWQVYAAQAPYVGGIGSALQVLGTGANGITGPNDLYAPTAGKLVGTSGNNSVVGRIVGSYHIDEDTNAYLSASRGRRPEAIQYNALPTDQGQGYAKETVPAETLTNFELGLKGSLAEGRFAYDLAAFYYKYKNFQSSVWKNGSYVTVNAGNAKAPGFEMSLQEAFNAELSAFFNYSYLHSRFDGSADGESYSGGRMRLAPDHSAAFGLDWHRPLWNDVVGYLRPSYTWRSKIHFEDNNPNYVQKAYGLLNLQAGVGFDHGHWEVGVFGANLTNKKYLIDAGNTGETFGLPTYIPGSPRTYGISLSGKF
jgi:outer membrane receptor protein involved in Fe transport